MKARIAAACAALLLTACSLDQFLFNGKAVESYTLSNRVIPDSLRAEGEWQVGSDRVAYVFARQPGTAPRLTMLYCHGNKHNVQEYWDRVEAYWSVGFDVLIFDYRGYGRSTGTPTEATMHADGEAALAHLRSRGVRDSSLIVQGFSLGGVCAIHLVARAVTPRAFIVEATFTSSEELVQSGAILDIPGQWLVRKPFDNVGEMSRVTAPTMIMHGDNDLFIPFRFGEALFAANRASIKRFVRIRGAGHSDIPKVLGYAAYAQLVKGFAQSPSSAGPTVLP